MRRHEKEEPSSIAVLFRGEGGFQISDCRVGQGHWCWYPAGINSVWPVDAHRNTNKMLGCHRTLRNKPQHNESCWRPSFPRFPVLYYELVRNGQEG